MLFYLSNCLTLKVISTYSYRAKNISLGNMIDTVLNLVSRICSIDANRVFSLSLSLPLSEYVYMV